jgi:hypothetical protein
MAIAQQRITPRYEVEQLPGTVERTLLVRNAETGINEEVVKEVPAGYMVYMSAGHSIHVWDDAELKRLGFDKPPELIDEDGDVVGTTQQLSLKRKAMQRSQASRRAATTPVDANQGD